MIEHLTEKTSFNQIYKLGLENRNLFIYLFFFSSDFEFRNLFSNQCICLHGFGIFFLIYLGLECCLQSVLQSWLEYDEYAIQLFMMLVNYAGHSAICLLYTHMMSVLFDYYYFILVNNAGHSTICFHAHTLVTKSAVLQCWIIANFCGMSVVLLVLVFISHWWLFLSVTFHHSTLLSITLFVVKAPGVRLEWEEVAS